MKRFIQIGITWVAFVSMFAINALANYLPINGYTTGAIAAFYPNKFVPDGFTFSIWSLIYLWLLVFAGYATNILVWLPGVDHRYHRIISILPLFWLSCLLNACWVLSWHYLHTGLSVIIMLVLLVTLVGIFIRIQKMAAHPRKPDHYLVELPMIVYLAWISVATIANITAFLVHSGWDGGSFGETAWTIIMMFAAVILAVYMAFVHHRPSFALVIAWALWGIFRKQAGVENVIANIAIIGLLACIAVSVPQLLHPKKGWKHKY